MFDKFRLVGVACHLERAINGIEAHPRHMVGYGVMKVEFGHCTGEVA